MKRPKPADPFRAKGLRNGGAPRPRVLVEEPQPLAPDSVDMKTPCYLPSSRTYFTSPSTCSGVRLLYAGILPLPLVMEFFSSASDCF